MNVPGDRHIVRVHSTPPAGAAMAGRPTYTGYVAKKIDGAHSLVARYLKRGTQVL